MRPGSDGVGGLKVGEGFDEPEAFVLCVWRRKIKFLAVCCGIAVNLFCNLNFNWDWAGCDSGNGGTFTGPSEIEKAGHVDMCVHSNVPANHGMSGQREINDLFGTCSSVSEIRFLRWSRPARSRQARGRRNHGIQ